MEYVVLPNSSLRVSKISYGTTGFDGAFPEKEGMALIERYIELGGNFLDTAHCYSFWVPGGFGESERFVGRAVKEFGRDRLLVATKGGHVGMTGYPRPDDFLNPKLVEQDLEESLDRLNLDKADVYYLHRDDPRVPVSEIISDLNRHVASGKVGALGASNWSVERYLEANRYALKNNLQPFSILQNQWSLATPDWSDRTSPGAMRYVEESETPALESEQIVVAAFTATASGYFATDGKTGGFDNPKNRARLNAIRKASDEMKVSPNQVALAYLLNQPFPVIPIIGTRNHVHLEDAITAVELTLDSGSVKTLVGG